MNQGLLMVVTGASDYRNLVPEGLLLRALGRRIKICMVAFGNRNKDWSYDTLTKRPEFRGFLEIYRPDDFKAVDNSADSGSAPHMWRIAKSKMFSGNFQIIMLNGLAAAIRDSCLDEKDILDSIWSRPDNVDVIICDAEVSDSLMEMADLVTEVKETNSTGNRDAGEYEGNPAPALKR